MTNVIFAKGVSSVEMTRGPSYSSEKITSSNQSLIETPSGATITQNLSLYRTVEYKLSFKLVEEAEKDALFDFVKEIGWSEQTFSFTDWNGDEHPFAKITSSSFREQEEEGYPGYYNIDLELRIENSPSGPA